MEQISLYLTLEEVNKILDSLGQQRYVDVFQLINKIQTQAEEQLQANKMRKQEFNSVDVESKIDAIT
jgi:hypothetical protein